MTDATTASAGRLKHRFPMLAAVTDLAGWWRRNLVDALETHAPGVTGRARPVRIAWHPDVQGGGRLVRLDGDGDEAGVSVDPAGVAASRPPFAAGPVVLVLPEGMVLTRSLSLPSAARAHLTRIVENQLGRLMPFQPGTAAFGAVVTGEDTAKSAIDVLVLATPRARLAAALTALDGAGIEVERITVDAVEAVHPGALDLTAQGRQPTTTSARPARRWPLVAAAAALGVLAMPVGVQHLRLAQATAGLEESLAEARPIAAVRREVLAAEADRGFLAERRAERPAAVLILARLTERLPDGTWLARVTLDATGGDLTAEIEGFSPQASALLPILAAEPAFAGPSFTAPVTRARPDEPERFTIQLRVLAEALISGEAS